MIKSKTFFQLMMFTLLTAWSFNYILAESNKIKTVKYRLIFFKESLSLFKNDVRRYPTSEEGLKILLLNTKNIDNWKGPYINNRILPTDAWGNPFIYKYIENSDGVKYIIYSFGKNQIDEYGFGDDIGIDER